jgi:FtsZ-binding cell division protein ZapB
VGDYFVDRASGLRVNAGHMWTWVLKIADKVSGAAMLREQFALAQARVTQLEIENAELKTKGAALAAELKLAREDCDQEKAEHQRLKDEHEEEVRIWKTVEYRKGKRTLNKWQPFCPQCHLPLMVSASHEFDHVSCSANCGWTAAISADEILKSLEYLKKEGA